MTRYKWKRFWCPRDGNCSLSDEGYLFDPEGEPGSRLNPELISLPALSDRRFLILLGEPGIGKSTEFSSEFARLQESTAGTTDKVIFVNLNEYQSDNRLVADAFETDTVRDWSSGQHTLHMFFDSLDEGRLEVRNIANILVGQFRQLAGNPDRLRIRIACRTAEWPSSLEHAMISTFGRENVIALELMPLRRVDVETALIAENLEPQAFLDNVADRNVEAFAINPITLQFLIGMHKRNGRFPSSRWELYEQGCRCLCEESSQSRRDAGHFGLLSAAQRLEVSSRIAALTVFCGRGVIDTGAAGTVDDSVLTVADLDGGNEEFSGTTFAISPAAVRETLGTALFSGRGPEKLGFAHRTYAEFLAARYLSRRRLDVTQQLSLLIHPASPTHVVPQLAETAAWVASNSEIVFEQVMSNDPQILLRSDVATPDDLTRARLVDRLIQGFQSGHLDDSEMSLRAHYGKLRNTLLPAHLAPVILDRNESVVTRRFAIDVAEACKDTRLVDSLLQVALDESDNPHVRAQASHAIIKIADDNACLRLTPLAFGDCGADPDDELRGSALKGLWSRELITAAKLFEHLPRPQNSSLIGTYRFFISEDIPRYLEDADLAIALTWCSKNPPYHDDIDLFKDAVSKIVERALRALSVKEIREAFADYAVSRMANYDDILEDMRSIAHLNVNVRRDLVIGIVQRLPSINSGIHGLLDGSPALLHDGDLRWILAAAADCTDGELGRRLGDLAKQMFIRGDQKDIDHVLKCCSANGMLNELFADLFDPIVIDSLAAKEMRRVHAMHQEREERSRLREVRRQPILDPPPAERILKTLAQLEGGDLTVWWQLCRDLQLGPRSNRYLHGHVADLTELPGWEAADAETRERIATAAKTYVWNWRTSPQNWLGRNMIEWRDEVLPGYRALVLVTLLSPEFFDQLTPERWANWAPVIFSFPCYFSIERAEFQQRLVFLAFLMAPDMIIESLNKVIDYEFRTRKGGRLFALHQISLCGGQQLADALLKRANAGSLTAAGTADIIEQLIRIDFGKAETFVMRAFNQYRMLWQNQHHPSRRTLLNSRSSAMAASARSLLRKLSQRDVANRRRRFERARELAKQVAVVFWVNASESNWDRLWKLLITDLRMFKDVVMDVADDRRTAMRHQTALNEKQTAELYIHLESHFPRAQDSCDHHAHFVSPRESVEHYRDQLLSELAERGTPDAIAEIKRIHSKLPHLDFLKRVMRSARRKMLEATWTPLTIRQAHEITHRPMSRLVRNDRELQNVILESLQRLQRKLHGETPAVVDLWYPSGPKKAKKWTPKDENAFSDYVKRHFDDDLRNCGIVSLREVEIRRGNGSTGERTDLYVIASVFGTDPGMFDTVRVIVEVKGCWHAELRTAMEAQLKSRYLRDNDCVCGIYLVGWFACDAWTTADTRQKHTPKWTLTEATDFFASQSKAFSDDGAYLKSVVIDAALR